LRGRRRKRRSQLEKCRGRREEERKGREAHLDPDNLPIRSDSRQLRKPA
jgi:hypothetical protein